MLGISSWGDAAAALTVLAMILGMLTALIRKTVVGPLEAKIEAATAELRPNGGESLKDRVVRIDATVKTILQSGE